MGNAGVKHHVDTAKKTGVLKVSQCKLNEFPQDFLQCEGNLRTLDISDNKFITLPNEIARFIHLKNLNLNKNKLTKIPDCIGALTKLDTLSICNNNLTSLPRTISNLIHLKAVYLSDNHFKEVPTVFCGLKHLDMLDLSRNDITAITADISTLNVTELNLNQNQIAELSGAIAQCPRLKTLRLEENCLQITSISTRMLVESKISNLTLEGNLFEMKQFQELEGYEAYMERYTAVKKKLF